MNPFRILLLLSVVIMRDNLVDAAGQSVGVCYGMLGNNLPAATDVVALYKRYGFAKMRLFNPDPAALNALRGSGISVIIGVANEDLPSIAGSPDAAKAWYTSHIAPFINNVNISTIAAGNEVVPGQFSSFVAPAMENLQSVLTSNNLKGIRVSTVVSTAPLGSSYPPSAGVFSEAASADMKSILSFLSKSGSPLLVNVYPYFAYAGQPDKIRLDYAQFNASGPVVQDGPLSYTNLFDAMVDSFFWAMEKAGAGNVPITVTESGWPSAGNGALTTPALATTYNKNFMQHISSRKGTPKKPGAAIEGYIFAMFNENQKAAGVEQNWGLFNPDMTPVDKIFNPSSLGQ